MSKLLAMMMKPKNYMYATIKGSLTENNGVFSGFSSSDYLELQQPFILNANTVAEIVFKINFDNETTQVYLGHPNTYGIQMTKGTADSKIHLYLGNNSSWTLIDNAPGTTVLSSLTDYYIKVVFNKGNVQVLLSTDKTNWTTEINRNITLTEEYSYIIDLGRGRTNTQYLKGSIDLNQSYIKINNTKYQLQAVVGYTVVGSPTITDGVVSGFSGGNYLICNKVFPNDIALNGFDCQIKFTMPNEINSDLQLIGIPFTNAAYGGIRVSSGLRLMMYIDGVSNYFRSDTNYLQLNNTYIVKYKIENNTMKLYCGTTINNLQLVGTKAIDSFTLTTYRDVCIGTTINQASAFTGSIDLNETYIKINNKLWFNGQPA